MFKRSNKAAKFTELCLSIFGAPKIGKTTLASFFKDGKKEPLFITTEDGTKALDVLEERIESWKQFTDLVKKLKEKEVDVRKNGSCFVLDLASELDALCTEHICDKYKIVSLGDIPHGKGWDIQGTEFQKYIRILSSILPIIFISHAKEKRVTHNGIEYAVQEPNYAKRAGEFVSRKCDMTAYIKTPLKEGNFPEVSFKPSLTAQCGNRFAFMAKQNFPLDPYNMQESYLLIKETFEKGVKGGK